MIPRIASKSQMHKIRESSWTNVCISNQLTAKGMHDHDGYKFCDWCHETLYVQRVKKYKLKNLAYKLTHIFS